MRGSYKLIQLSELIQELPWEDMSIFSHAFDNQIRMLEENNNLNPDTIANVLIHVAQHFLDNEDGNEWWLDLEPKPTQEANV